MPHANARLNLRGRQLLIDRVVHQGRPVAHVAHELGIARQTGYRWVWRWRAEGADGLVDRSSRPRTSPSRTPAALEDAICAARARDRSGPDVLGAALGVPARTITRVLRRRGMPLLRDLDPLTGQVVRASKATAVRYERDRPGELVHVDVKKLGRIPDGGGWRALGRDVADRHRDDPIGFDYVHSMVDDHSRLAYSEILADEKGATCAGFVTRAAAYFAAHGITRIERIMTDNAWAHRWSLRDVAADLGAKQVFIRPHCPWQNGKVERLNRTLQTEWAYRQVFTTNDERAAALAPWLEHYNTRRRHNALGGLPPVSRLSPT
ncbi:IS481 family transposase [Cellulomonas fimi]|uniref:Integrase catalytic region n=1 Tax=Cellulomonas fimi (strain ATCC 484 / DSM 20113 / JCM 1341 / CCUG 24087 / LMG 16345 / NBRC 15513 / NCIMB 8980 / NCTC 7547 / NRS-133) TaxID=590998 RepID=F4H3K1_CELFA|nr:IS481 family transposase [Cellulomonas fimi]AEE46546.1 Integrase catalytic region [Cellulomonas fimi ATCC 484]